MKDVIAKVVNLLNDHWEDFVAMVQKVWQFLKDTILKDDSIWADATTGE